MDLLVILHILFALLKADGASPLLLECAETQLTFLAEALESAPVEKQALLISLGFEESRFGARYVFEGKQIKGKANDCGVWQQIPKWSPIKTTCLDLQMSDHALEVVLAKLSEIEKRWGSPLKAENLCHYKGGNSCGKASRAYARRVLSRIKEIKRLEGEALVELEAWGELD